MANNKHYAFYSVHYYFLTVPSLGPSPRAPSKGVTELVTNPPNSSQTEGWHEMTQEEAKKKWEVMQ